MDTLPASIEPGLSPTEISDKTSNGSRESSTKTLHRRFGSGFWLHQSGESLLK